MTLAPGARALVPTGFIMEIPEGFEPRSAALRSCLQERRNLPQHTRTIDSDYRGEVKVLLINLGQEDFIITRGMRIAQMVIAPVTQVRVTEVTETSDTARGAGGFGSTGV